LLRIFAPILISLGTLFYTVTANRTSRKIARRNWRKEKIHALADEICEIAADYWLTEEDDVENKKRALGLKYRLTDIELHGTALGINVSGIIEKMSDHATGGLFETPGRKALATDNEKFLQLRLQSQLLKEKIGDH